MKMNTSAFKKLEFSSLEKEILFEHISLSKNNSYSELNFESNSKNKENGLDFILNSKQFIDVHKKILSQFFFI